MSRLSSLRAADAAPEAPSSGSTGTSPVEISEVGRPGAAALPPLAALDAAGRISLLNEAFRSRPETQPHPAPSASAKLARRLWALRGRALKTFVGLVVLVTAGWLPVRALFETTSTEAVINARLITLRAPIEGQIGPFDALSVGTQVLPGATLVSLANPRADRGRLDDLRRLVDQLESENRALLARRDDLKTLRDDLTAQTLAFQQGRIHQLEARVAEIRSEIGAAVARRAEADQTLQRTEALMTGGVTTKAGLDRARRDATVAAETLAALGHRQTALEVELSSLRQGVYVGDSYNDRPQSVQRTDDIALRLSELTGEISQREARLGALRAELAAETERYAERAGATLVAPVRGSIWEVMTAPGESVVRGQDLMRVLDCSGVVITATVGETAYNQLRIGDAARFRFRGESTDHHGRIIGLTGVATAPANLAIQPSALAKEPYRVTVALPELAKPGECNVGRTGRVTFGK
jgi:multidrug resistance efflux pump